MDMQTGAIPAGGFSTPALFRARDPLSALSHFVGFLLSILAAFPLLVKASCVGCSLTEILSLCAFTYMSIFPWMFKLWVLGMVYLFTVLHPPVHSVGPSPHAASVHHRGSLYCSCAGRTT